MDLARVAREAVRATARSPAPVVVPLRPRLLPRGPEPLGAVVAALERRETEAAEERTLAPAAPGGLTAVLSQLPTQPVPLAPGAQTLLESLMGQDLSRLAVHSDAVTDAALVEIGIDAATVREHLYLRSGRASPETSEGARLLLAAVTQALAGGEGPVDPTARLTDPAQAESTVVPAPPPAPVPPTELGETPEAPPVEAPPTEAAVPEVAAPEAAPPVEGEPAVEGEGEEAPEEPVIELLMPPAPTEPSPAQQERVGRVVGTARRTARAAADLPTAEETTTQARGAVEEPTVETAARARAELAAELGERQPPSPQIVDLCDEIRAAIRERRPVDEDELTQANPQAAAREAGETLTRTVEGEAQRVQQDYDAINHPGAGTPQLEPTGIATPPAGVSDPGIAATDAAPDAIPPENLSLDADREAVDRRIEESRIERPTTEPLQEPPFSTVREGRDELGQMAAARPEELAAAQQQAIDQATVDMGELQIRAVEALRASRGRTVTGVRGRQDRMVETEEETRSRISAEAQGIFDQTRTEVNALVAPLSQRALQRWDAGVTRLSGEFRAHLDEVQSWIDERHSGVGGSIVGLWDDLTGLPDWVTEEYDAAERRFGDGVCELLLDISSEVNGIVAAAEALIEDARTRIDGLFDDLPDGLQEWAAGERARFGAQLDGLQQQVTEARTSFVDEVSRRAVSAVAEVQAEVERLREEAKGLIGRIADAIGEFLDDPITAIINGLLRLVGIPPASFWALVERIQQVISDIADDPIGFVNNLVDAIRLGFEGFFERFEQHVIAGFWQWLFSGLGSVGVQLPSDYGLRSLVTFVLQLMGITWPRIREILVRHVGEENVALIERAWELVSTLIELGPEGIFNMLRERLDPSRILTEILNAAIEFMIEALIRQVAIRVIGLLNPAGAVIQAIELIYRVLRWVFENAARIFRLVETVVNAIADILAGNLGAVAAAIEGALASLVPLVIDFLAGLLGLGDLPEQIAAVIGRLQEFVLGIVDQIIGWLVTQAQALLAAIGLGPEEEEPEEEGEAPEDVELGTSVPFTADGESHRQWVEVVGEDATLMVATTPEHVEARLAAWEGQLGERFGDDDDTRYEATALIGSARTILNDTEATADALAAAYANAGELPPGEELPSDERVERRQIALTRVLAQLFELFGDEPDPTVLYAEQLGATHMAARGSITEALTGLDELPPRWTDARNRILADDEDVRETDARPLNQSHPFGRSFAHQWAAQAVLSGMNAAFAEQPANDGVRQRINAVFVEYQRRGELAGANTVSPPGATHYLVRYKAQVHIEEAPFDVAPPPVVRTRETVWQALVEQSAWDRIRDTFSERVRMGIGQPPGPELPAFIRLRVWELLEQAVLAPPWGAGDNVHIEIAPTSTQTITSYLQQEAQANPDPALREALTWWAENILAPEFHHAWPQWLGGPADQTQIFIPRALHNFDGIATDPENFPGGFHQVFNGLFRQHFPQVPVNDAAAWATYRDTHPMAHAIVEFLLVQAYQAIFAGFGPAGQQALARFVAGVRRGFPVQG